MVLNALNPKGGVVLVLYQSITEEQLSSPTLSSTLIFCNVERISWQSRGVFIS